MAYHVSGHWIQVVGPKRISRAEKWLVDLSCNNVTQPDGSFPRVEQINFEQTEHLPKTLNDAENSLPGKTKGTKKKSNHQSVIPEKPCAAGLTQVLWCCQMPGRECPTSRNHVPFWLTLAMVLRRLIASAGTLLSTNWSSPGSVWRLAHQLAWSDWWLHQLWRGPPLLRGQWVDDQCTAWTFAWGQSLFPLTWFHARDTG